jgi:hypothetical protein
MTLTLIARVKEKAMAKRNLWVGMLAMVLVFGMMVVNCDIDSDTVLQNKITVTELPGGYNGYEIMLILQPSWNSDMVAFGDGIISGDSVTMPLYKADGNPWTGFGSYILMLLIGETVDSSTYPHLYTNGRTYTQLAISDMDNLYKLPKYDFSEAMSSVEFGKFRSILWIIYETP